MAFLDFYTKIGQNKLKAANLYNSLVSYSRNPTLFRELGIEDTVDGRFDCIALHLSLMLRRMKLEGDELRCMAVELVSVFVMDMDRSLREMGVGDLSVGKHIKKMTSAFYGRAEAYEMALCSQDQKDLPDVLERNLFRKVEVSKEILNAMTKYVYETDEKFKTLKVESLKEGLFLL